MSAPTVPTVTVAEGVTINANMTPTERYNAVAKSLGAPTLDKPAPAQQWHTPDSVSRMAQLEAQAAERGAVKPTPAAPVKPAEQQADPNQLAKFDAEMRAAGAQITPTTPVEPFKVDESGLEKLHAEFRENMQSLQSLPHLSGARREREIADLRKTYSKDLVEMYEGRQGGESSEAFQARKATPGQPAAGVDQRSIDYLQKLARETPANQQTDEWRMTWNRDYAQTLEGRKYGETRAAFEARKAGTAPAATADAATNAAVDVAVKASDKEGFAPAESITGPLLHGYTIPTGVTWHVADLTANLKRARAGGLSQDQVSRILAAEMQK